jgi:hypothetical protein
MSTVDPAADSGALVSVPWWRNVAERAIRQALQVATPILAAIVGSGNGLDLGATIGAIVVAVVLSVVKSAAGARADADSPLAVQLLDRAVSALAFTLLSFLPVAWVDWASVDWGKAFGAAVAAGALAVVQFYLNPPAFATPKQSDQTLAA